jgi:hypothetical protein
VVLHQREIEAALTILAKRGVSSFKGGEKSNLNFIGCIGRPAKRDSGSKAGR